MEKIKQLTTSERKQRFEELYAFGSAWAERRMMPFNVEEMRKAYLEETKTDILAQVFSFIVRELFKNGIVKKHEIIRSPYKQQKGRMIQVWISLKYSNSQRDKRETASTKVARESQVNIEFK